MHNLHNWLSPIGRHSFRDALTQNRRPMYSSNYARYQENIQDAFQSILLNAGVDMYLAGHIHW